MCKHTHLKTLLDGMFHPSLLPLFIPMVLVIVIFVLPPLLPLLIIVLVLVLVIIIISFILTVTLESVFLLKESERLDFGAEAFRLEARYEFLVRQQCCWVSFWSACASHKTRFFWRDRGIILNKKKRPVGSGGKRMVVQ